MKEERQILAPKALQDLQGGFAKSIRTPVSFKTGKFTFQIKTYAPATVALILARAPQSGAERLAIYNEQYWYRLFTILQEEFPLLSNYLGFWEFNQLASRYLDSNPSESAFLESLGLKFEDWFQKNTSSESPLLAQIIRLESLFHQVFHAPGFNFPEVGNFLETMPEIGESMLEIGEESILKFKAGFSLFEEDWNIMAERNRLRQAQGQPFKMKPIPQKGYWAIYRKDGYPEWLELNSMAFRLLVSLQKGSPIGEACAEIAETLEEEALEELVRSLPNWFTTWTALGWFVHTTAH